MTGRQNLSEMTSADFLVFVEDPGAANCVAPIVLGLERQGSAVAVVAVGLARGCLVRRGLARFLRDASQAAAPMLDVLRPRVLVIGTAENPATLALDLVVESRLRNIVSVGVVDAAMNAEHRFRGVGPAAVSYLPDWIVVPDEWTRDAFVKAGAAAAQVVVCGNAHADYVRDVATGLAPYNRSAIRRTRVPAAKDGQKLVVFATEGSARRDSAGRCTGRFDGCVLRPEVSRSGRTEILLEAFVQALREIAPKPYLVVRVHPKDEIADYEVFGSDVDLFDKDRDALDLLYCADVVAGATSMLLQEAAWLGSPTLSLVPCAEQAEWLPMTRAGVTPAVTSMRQLRAILPRLLQQSDDPVSRTPHEDRGSATERILTLLNTLIAAPVTAFP